MSHVTCLSEEKINSQKFWKLKKKIAGKHTDPPAAMLDNDSNLLTSDKTKQERAIEVYKKHFHRKQYREALG